MAGFTPYIEANLRRHSEGVGRVTSRPHDVKLFDDDSPVVQIEKAPIVSAKPELTSPTAFSDLAALNKQLKDLNKVLDIRMRGHCDHNEEIDFLKSEVLPELDVLVGGMTETQKCLVIKHKDFESIQEFFTLYSSLILRAGLEAELVDKLALPVKASLKALGEYKPGNSKVGELLKKDLLRLCLAALNTIAVSVGTPKAMEDKSFQEARNNVIEGMRELRSHLIQGTKYVIPQGAVQDKSNFILAMFETYRAISDNTEKCDLLLANMEQNDRLYRFMRTKLVLSQLKELGYVSA